MCENCEKALEEYQKKIAQLREEYEKKKALLWEEYEKKEAKCKEAD